MTAPQSALPRLANREFKYVVSALSSAGTREAAAISSQKGRALGIGSMGAAGIPKSLQRDRQSSSILQSSVSCLQRADKDKLSEALPNNRLLPNNYYDLRQHDYVTANSFDEWGEAIYHLTNKARKFLIERNLI